MELLIDHSKGKHYYGDSGGFQNQRSFENNLVHVGENYLSNLPWDCITYIGSIFVITREDN